ncbi:hypothetical protein RHSIM_Rhsim12G0075500 [Rhododendron simsii]|uniref:X8 domain-containing protein n=1 Tax=Rhododendron simsii TaxID=118357 RepID=A0A834G8H4_RHOSS|nr:hypothetical protein RHSIM_Rhsim12G0075500 [Rhododendron simsii]
MAAVVVLCLVTFLAMAGHSTATYCICKDGLSDSVLQKDIDYACANGADCSHILQNGSCYNPVTVKDHCNYAVNSYYQRKNQVSGSCDFSGTATTTQTVPNQSSGCVYPSSPSVPLVERYPSCFYEALVMNHEWEWEAIPMALAYPSYGFSAHCRKYQYNPNARPIYKPEYPINWNNPFYYYSLNFRANHRKWKHNQRRQQGHCDYSPPKNTLVLVSHPNPAALRPLVCEGLIDLRLRFRHGSLGKACASSEE